MAGVYITKTSHFLPNRPVANDVMEQYLGQLGERSSWAKAVVLRNNKIKNRYYAIDDHGEITHTNAELSACSINQLFDNEFSAQELELLAVGTSSPDTMMPSHGSQVHSLLKNTKNIPVFSSAGVCCSSMHALEIAYLSILQGRVSSAVACGSELLSPLLRAEFFDIEYNKLRELQENALLAFDKDFLRFMLSDGSGAFLLQNKPNPSGLSLEIEWMDSVSYANELPPCMYQGCTRDENNKLKSWKKMHTSEWENQSVFAIKQDTRILENIIPKAVEFFKKSLEKHDVKGSDIHYFLPHISSMYFYNKLVEGFQQAQIDVPEALFYCCLPEIGNIGAASIYATLDKLTQEKTLKKGELIVLGVPESSQFQYSVAALRVV